VEGWSWASGGSYVRTSRPYPWRFAASAAVAPKFPLLFPSFNKVGVFGLGGLVPPSRHGGGWRHEAQGFGAPRKVQDATSSGVHQRRRVCAAVIFGQRGHSMLCCCVRHSVFNLLAGVPRWRPFNNGSAAATFVAPSSSGVVPDDGADGRSVEPLRWRRT
jgi:hypothetical protein